MVRIVPALPHGQDAEEDIIPTLIVTVIRLHPPQMTCGIDAPGDVMHQENANQAPHINPVQAPIQLEEMIPPSTAGKIRLKATQSGNKSFAIRRLRMFFKSLI